MPSTPRASRRGAGRRARPGRARLLALAVLLALGVTAAVVTQASADPAQDLPPHFPEHPTQTPNWQPPNWPPPHGETAAPEDPPAESPPPSSPQSSAGSGAVAGASASGATPSVGRVAGAKGRGRSPRSAAPAPAIVQPQPNPSAVHAKKHAKRAPKEAGAPPPPPPVVPAPAPEANPERSTFADELLTPGEVDLSAENLGEGGLLALLLAALLYLPVTIFNKATEKNHEAISRWFARPKALLAATFGWIPARRHPLVTLTGGVLASAALFAFIEPGFPGEEGALQYLIGMVIGFTLVSVVFFATWWLVLRRLEPEGTGHWRVYPPYILLAAFLVVMARLAHFIPGVVLGTVAEYEPAKRLSTRTAGIRVLTTYSGLIVLGLAAWFAWIPVEHAASEHGASSLTLILDSALAVTFVSSLESIAFGLVPMTFLDGADLFRWHKGAWAALWGASLVWFSIVILHPALSTYQHHAHAGVVWFVLLFSTLMLVALATWAFFRLRAFRQARASAAAS